MTTSNRFTVTRQALVETEVSPVSYRMTESGNLLLDFGKAAFGTLLVPGCDGRKKLVVHLGEMLSSKGELEREPPGTIRYCRIEQKITANQTTVRLVIPPDERNTGPAAIKMPAEIGEVLPFRYAEIEVPEGIDAMAVRQVFVHYPFDDNAARFESSDETLNAVWELCKYSIKATTFCGVYVDGDRERIPYEGDAYINQLGHYGVDSEYALARYTHEYLIQNPTWPTEWQLHSVMMAWMDYLYTSETASLETFYDDLCVKCLIDLAREDGLISTETELCTRDLEQRLHFYGDTYIFGHGLRDLVDWPPGSFQESGQGERDNHEMLPVNTVVNAFHCHALNLMSKIAQVLGREADRSCFERQSERVCGVINALLFDEVKGVYIDGEGSRHASLHSNMFMMAFGLVPEDRQESVLAFIKSRGMACSVYGAQHLLEALYLHGEDEYACDLMTARHDRGWWNMIQAGSTMTLEAWDLRYKNNLDWNHAWGAAPANIIPRFMLGVRPLEAGFRKVLIQPQAGGLTRVAGTVPTPHGPIQVTREMRTEHSGFLRVSIPGGITAKIALRLDEGDTTLTCNGTELSPVYEGGNAVVDDVSSGTFVLEWAR